MLVVHQTEFTLWVHNQKLHGDGRLLRHSKIVYALSPAMFGCLVKKRSHVHPKKINILILFFSIMCDTLFFFFEIFIYGCKKDKCAFYFFKNYFFFAFVSLVLHSKKKDCPSGSCVTTDGNHFPTLHPHSNLHSSW